MVFGAQPYVYKHHNSKCENLRLGVNFSDLWRALHEEKWSGTQLKNINEPPGNHVCKLCSKSVKAPQKSTSGPIHAKTATTKEGRRSGNASLGIPAMERSWGE